MVGVQYGQFSGSVSVCGVNSPAGVTTDENTLLVSWYNSTHSLWSVFEDEDLSTLQKDCLKNIILQRYFILRRRSSSRVSITLLSWLRFNKSRLPPSTGRPSERGGVETWRSPVRATARRTAPNWNNSRMRSPLTIRLGSEDESATTVPGSGYGGWLESSYSWPYSCRVCKFISLNVRPDIMKPEDKMGDADRVPTSYLMASSLLP